MIRIITNVNNQFVKKTNETGQSDGTSNLEELPEDERNQIKQMTNEQLTGTQIVGQDGQVNIKSTNGQMMGVRTMGTGNFTITGSEGSELLAINTVFPDSKYAQ